MKIRTGMPVRLISFLGETESPPGIPAFDDYWKLIGLEGEVLRGEPGEKLVLVRFSADLTAMGLAHHNNIPDSLFISKSDLEVIEEKLPPQVLEKPELVSCMTDQKWHKVFQLILQHSGDITFIKIKYILDDNIYDLSIKDKGDFDAVSVREKDNVVVTFKEIQYLQVYCKEGDATTELSKPAMMAHELQSQGQYSVDIAPLYIKIYGYEHHRGE